MTNQTLPIDHEAVADRATRVLRYRGGSRLWSDLSRDLRPTPRDVLWECLTESPAFIVQRGYRLLPSPEGDGTWVIRGRPCMVVSLASETQDVYLFSSRFGLLTLHDIVEAIKSELSENPHPIKSLELRIKVGINLGGVKITQAPWNEAVETFRALGLWTRDLIQ